MVVAEFYQSAKFNFLTLYGFEMQWLTLKKKNDKEKMKNCENELYNFNAFPVI